MHRLVLLRHGESVWNRENRFTGWTDVDLSERGRAEAHDGGRLLREGGFVFDTAFTSVLLLMVGQGSAAVGLAVLARTVQLAFGRRRAAGTKQTET